MNKPILFLLLAISINLINGYLYFSNCSDYDYNYHAYARGDFGEDVCILFETTGDITHCCYVTGSTNSSINDNCIGLTDDQHENIKYLVKYYKDHYDPNIEIKCKSEYISISLFSILALLF